MIEEEEEEEEEDEEEEEVNLFVWLPCRPRKHIYKPNGHNSLLFEIYLR